MQQSANAFNVVVCWYHLFSTWLSRVTKWQFSPRTCKWGEMLQNPCILGVPKQRGTKSELAASTQPSRGPKNGRKRYIIPAFLGVPKQRGTKSEMAASTLPSRGPKQWRKCYITRAFSGVPKQRGTKSGLAAPTLPSRRPKSGQKCYRTPAFLGVPNKGDNIKAQNKNKKNSILSLLTLPRVLQIAPTRDWTHDLSVAEALLYPLGYGPSLTYLCTGVVLIFGPNWFSFIHHWVFHSIPSLSILSIDT